jgi:hypothetical protein
MQMFHNLTGVAVSENNDRNSKNFYFALYCLAIIVNKVTHMHKHHATEPSGDVSSVSLLHNPDHETQDSRKFRSAADMDYLRGNPWSPLISTLHT